MQNRRDISAMTDMEIVQAILRRDVAVTKEYLYKKCYPLFKSIYDKYYTDCENWVEFVNEIYLYILIPKQDTGSCKLADFGFRCTFLMWLKVVAENYCRQLYARRADIFDRNVDAGDRFDRQDHSLEIDLKSLDMEDVHKILALMPNQRYRTLIEYRYVELHTNEETAEHLSMTMANYYNKHKLAKAQFIAALRKEGLA